MGFHSGLKIIADPDPNPKITNPDLSLIIRPWPNGLGLDPDPNQVASLDLGITLVLV